MRVRERDACGVRRDRHLLPPTIIYRVLIHKEVFIDSFSEDDVCDKQSFSTSKQEFYVLNVTS